MMSKQTTRKVSARRAAEIHAGVERIYAEGTEQDTGASRLRQQYWKEWGKPPEGEGPHDDRGGPAYVPWLEAKLSKMEEALGDGGDLEHAANLLQEATNDHGIDQSFDGNPYDLSDRLRMMAEALAGGEEA